MKTLKTIVLAIVIAYVLPFLYACADSCGGIFSKGPGVNTFQIDSLLIETRDFGADRITSTTDTIEYTTLIYRVQAILDQIVLLNGGFSAIACSPGFEFTQLITSVDISANVPIRFEGVDYGAGESLTEHFIFYDIFLYYNWVGTEKNATDFDEYDTYFFQERDLDFKLIHKPEFTVQPTFTFQFKLDDGSEIIIHSSPVFIRS